MFSPTTAILAVCAVVSRFNQGQVDAASIDAVIRCDGPADPIRLDVQLKCTARDAPFPDPLPFRLASKNYNELRRRISMPPGPSRARPRRRRWAAAAAGSAPKCTCGPSGAVNRS